MKKRIAIYPGSFNPLHTGHLDIVEKALDLFDEVIIAVGVNTKKILVQKVFDASLFYKRYRGQVHNNRVQLTTFTGLLTDFTKEYKGEDVCIVRGLRNGADLEYEKTQQYWYEDLGLDIPIIYIIADRNLCHISSSAIRAVREAKNQ